MKKRMQPRRGFLGMCCTKHKLMRLNDKLLSRKRSIIETIIDQLKNAVRARRVSRRKKRNKTISQIEHSRHRSPVNFCTNVLCGLIAYCHQPKNPSIGFEWVFPSAA
jgi:hypothetical protein